MSNPNLQKIIKLTQAQYDTLDAGGTIGGYTGLDDHYLYLIQSSDAAPLPYYETTTDMGVRTFLQAHPETNGKVIALLLTDINKTYIARLVYANSTYSFKMQEAASLVWYKDEGNSTPNSTFQQLLNWPYALTEEIGAQPSTTDFPTAAAVYNFATIESITYANLVLKRSRSELIPGKQYRITDYTCTTTQLNTTVNYAPFDIIVTADDVDKLNENARATNNYYERMYDHGYGPGISAWQLKYCLDNDNDRFAWANSAGGKGVIYWLRDEYGNEAPYDFKQIQFYRTVDNMTGLYSTAQSAVTRAVYTFNIWSNYTSKDASVFGNDGTFTDDEGLVAGVMNNVIQPYYNPNTIEAGIQMALNDIAILSTCDLDQAYWGFWHNTFGPDCRLITLNSRDWGTHSNYFQQDDAVIILYDGCQYNNFGSNCNNNTLGSLSVHNTVGPFCHHITLTTSSNFNIFDGNNSYINCQCEFESNRFGAGVHDITVSNGVDGFYHNIIDSGAAYLNLWNPDEESIVNIHIHPGITGTSQQAKSISVESEDYSRDYYANNSQSIILN